MSISSTPEGLDALDHATIADPVGGRGEIRDGPRQSPGDAACDQRTTSRAKRPVPAITSHAMRERWFGPARDSVNRKAPTTFSVVSSLIGVTTTISLLVVDDGLPARARATAASPLGGPLPKTSLPRGRTR